LPGAQPVPARAMGRIMGEAGMGVDRGGLINLLSV
jgi:hypothetical protein